jgi:hypothetical protein
MNITAAQARDITHKSLGLALSQIKPIEQLIKAAAENGESSVVYHIGAVRMGQGIPENPITTNTVRILRNAGFHADLRCETQSYVPKGLQDDSGNGPAHVNYGIYISWR